MADKILCVDDDPNILAAYQRSLRKQFALDTATDPQEGLRKLAQGAYAVVVSDMNMPGMNGIEFLGQARLVAPDCVRMMLTGNADLRTAMQALHEGRIFQFLVKPCPPESLVLALEAGLKQHHLLTAERDLLEKTLQGAIRVLVEILSAVDPESFGRAQTLRQDMRLLAEALDAGDRWKLELAALLSQIGLVTIPSPVLRKRRAGQPLTETETYMLTRVPQISHNLLVNIPRLEGVARIILYQDKHYDGSGFPADGLAGESLPLGARMLKVLTDMAAGVAGGLSRRDALSQMRARINHYDPQVLEAACACFTPPQEGAGFLAKPSVPMLVKDLRVGHVLASHVENSDGTLLISAGHRLTDTLLERIKNFMELKGIREPIHVECADDRT